MNYRIVPAEGKRNRFVIQKKVFGFFWSTLMDKMAHPRMPKEYILDKAKSELEKLLDVQ